jgi:Transcriptional regulators
MNYNELTDFLFDHMKKIFFPQEWLKIDLKFSKSELFAMLVIDKRGEITMSELAEYINSPLSTATGIVDRLVKSGCLKRERSEEDRRIVVLRLGEKGTQIVRDLKELISGCIDTVFEELSPEETEFLFRIIVKIVNRLQEKPVGKPADHENKLHKIEIE